MVVIVKDKAYKGVEPQVANSIIAAAGKLCRPPCIFAVEKDDVVELRNYTYKNKLTYRSAYASFAKKGFKVYGREN